MHETPVEPRSYAHIHSCNLAITRTLSPYKMINLPQPIRDTFKKRWKIDLNQHMYYMFMKSRKLASTTRLYFHAEFGLNQTLYCHTF